MKFRFCTHVIGSVASFMLLACGGGAASGPQGHSGHRCPHADHASGHPGSEAEGATCEHHSGHGHHGGEGHHGGPGHHGGHGRHHGQGGHHGGHGQGQGPHHAGQGHNHDFSDVERFAQIFDNPERDAWQRPEEVVALLQLSAGQVVADLGAGTGYFLPHLSGPIGSEGRVLALDVEPAMVEHMRARAAEAELTNVEPAQVPADSPGMEAASVDRILIVDTWHHFSNRGEYAAHLRTALRPGGTILIVDFAADSPHGPPPAMRLTPEVIVAELESAGLVAEVLEESLPYQYVIRARAAD